MCDINVFTSTDSHLRSNQGSIFNESSLGSMSGFCFIHDKFYYLTNHNMILWFVEGRPVLGWQCSAAAPQTSKHDLGHFVSPVRCSSGDEIGFVEGLQTLAACLLVNDNMVHQFSKNTGSITTGSLGLIPS